MTTPGRESFRSPGTPKRLTSRSEAEPYDPLRLCIYATVAVIAWLLGPWAVLGFAVLGLVGYIRARRAGLLQSKCKLRDTRLVIGYLAVIALAALGAIGWRLWNWAS